MGIRRAVFPGASKRRVWGMRFPRRDEPMHGEVITYTLPQEEIVCRYGPSLQMLLPEEKFREYQAKRYSIEKIAKETGLTTQQVRYVQNYYNMKRVTPLNNKKITKEQFIQMRAEGYTMHQIAMKVDVSLGTLYKYQRAWGIFGKVMLDDAVHK